MSSIPFLYVNVIALCCFTVLFATFVAAKKSPEIITFMLLLADCIVWLGSAILMRLQLWPGLRFWFYLSFLSLFAVAWFFYLFLLRFARRKEPFTLAVWTVLNAVELLISTTGFFLKPPTPTSTAEGTVFLYSIDWRIGIPVLFYTVFIFYLFRVMQRVVKEQGIHSPGLLLVIIGGGVMGLGNVLQIGIPGNTFPYDALCGIVFAFFLLLALYRKRLFHLTLVVSRSLLLLVLALICVISATYIISPLEQFLIATFGLSWEIATVVVSILFAAILFLTYAMAKHMIDSLFTREVQQNRLLKQFTSEASQSLDTTAIMEKLSAAVLGEIPVERIYICLREKDGFEAKYCSSPLASLSFSFPADSPQITYLRTMENYLMISEFAASPLYLSSWESEKELFRRLDIDCIAAMKDGDEVIGLILLSAKDRGKNFTYVETSYLETISSVAAIAMKNAYLYEKMYREARIDALTGVYNYRYFVEQEEEQFRRCQSDCLTLMFADVDDLKLYNQLYGVGAGDDALRRISQEILRCAEGSGTVFRTSGKVFAILLPHQDARRAVSLAEEISRRVSMLNRAPDRVNLKPLSVSIGICAAPYAASSAKELLDNADLAAYNAKQSGKNQISVFRGVTSVVPQHLADRTDAIVSHTEQDSEKYQNAIAMISALTAAIDAKDHYTYAHSKNVARYAANLAVAAGLNDDQVRTTYSAGLLHDIGKISIPEDILNKSGKLTDHEYDVMKSHVNNSIDMIRHLPEMDYLVPAVLGHHECWDGRGYPRGLAGEEIPVTARCLAIADVFDAITTDRPYRGGMPLEYALRQIEDGAGSQFDPHLSAVFVQLVRGQNIPLAEQVHA